MPLTHKEVPPATRTCKECGKTKDVKRGFYKSSGLLCRDCKGEQSHERNKAVGGKVITLLEEILANQRELAERMDQLEDSLGERMDEMDARVEKVRKALKKLAVD